jgi:hypothetical protein
MSTEAGPRWLRPRGAIGLGEHGNDDGSVAITPFLREAMELDEVDGVVHHLVAVGATET